jgi:protein-arginine kinase activator protein McsA
LFEDHGSARIDLACAHCRQTFKVRLRKLQFGADLTCRLCWHEFSTQEVSIHPEVRDGLTRMHRIVEQRTQLTGPC